MQHIQTFVAGTRDLCNKLGAIAARRGRRIWARPCFGARPFCAPSPRAAAQCQFRNDEEAAARGGPRASCKEFPAREHEEPTAALRGKALTLRWESLAAALNNAVNNEPPSPAPAPASARAAPAAACGTELDELAQAVEQLQEPLDRYSSS